MKDHSPVAAEPLPVVSPADREPAGGFGANVWCVECDSPPEDCRCDDDFMGNWFEDPDMGAR